LRSNEVTAIGKGLIRDVKICGSIYFKVRKESPFFQIHFFNEGCSLSFLLYMKKNLLLWRQLESR